MEKASSRGPTIDIEHCTEAAGGNRFNLVLIASVRAREIARKHKRDEDYANIGNTVTALLEIQNGSIGKEYLKKV